MKIWAIANQKGGVGKTTTAVTLAGLLAEKGHRTLLVDMDPHGSLTSYFGFDPDELSDSIYNFFQAVANGTAIDPEPVIRDTRVANLQLMPASMALATLDRQLGIRKGTGLVMVKALRAVKDQFEYVLIDCPPVLGVLMINALAACEKLLVPVQTEFLAQKGLERMLKTLDMVQRSGQEALPRVIIPTMYDRRTRASIDSWAALRKSYPEDIWESTIPVDTGFRDASKTGLPLPMLRPRARGVLAYNKLLQYLLKPEQTVIEMQAQAS
ncbi:MAG TPA: ParA family protein [Gammaproteobacteria bacterium]|nr:ParA family protein [Gammaproteobacteria bacterium]